MFKKNFCDKSRKGRKRFFRCLANNCDIPRSILARVQYAKDIVGDDFDIKIRHPHGIIIYPKAIIGKRVVLNGLNVIGNWNGYPRIGDGVYFGVGSVVIGNIVIGNNVKIGANATITKDVPSNCVVVGNNKIIFNGE